MTKRVRQETPEDQARHEVGIAGEPGDVGNHQGGAHHPAPGQSLVALWPVRGPTRLHLHKLAEEFPRTAVEERVHRLPTTLRRQFGLEPIDVMLLDEIALAAIGGQPLMLYLTEIQSQEFLSNSSSIIGPPPSGIISTRIRPSS
jgi:hypothetical protein